MKTVLRNSFFLVSLQNLELAVFEYRKLTRMGMTLNGKKVGFR